MASGKTLRLNQTVRGMIVGYPGSGKTGALASLVNAGFKLRILDYDGNLEPLLLYSDPDLFDANVDIMQFEDRMRNGPQFMEPIGIPQAFNNGLKAMTEWKYPNPDGTETSLGSSKDWGPDTIVVLDSLTKMGDAAMRRAQKMMNKNPLNTTQQVWGLAMADQLAFIELLTSTSNRFHVLVLAHLKMIGPKEIGKGESDANKEIKEKVADLIPTKFFPRALGYELPQSIGGEFPTLLEATTEYTGSKVKRIFRTVPRSDLDVKVPAAKLPPTLELSTGLLQVFEAISPASVALVRQQVRDMGAGAPATKETT